LAQAVKVCAESQTPFAVKSGGHGHFAGQSSITGGVQLDLTRLNNISVNNEKTSVWVGSGNSWAAVYKKLEKIGRIAVGGRAASVGVGGFILGGMVQTLHLFWTICADSPQVEYRSTLPVTDGQSTMFAPLKSPLPTEGSS
jgi:FAD/FMN-containing dehydrogenase